MNSLLVLGKFLDQPKLVSKFATKVSVFLGIGAAGVCAFDTFNAPKNQRKEVFVKDSSVMIFTIFSALISAKKSNKNSVAKELEQGKIELVNKFLNKNALDEKSIQLLTKSKTNILSFSEIKILYDKFNKNRAGKVFLNKLIPRSKNITSKEMFEEMKRLSKMGLFAVFGGILGGITGDIINKKDWKKSLPDKVKEGTYQFLSNIFLCNVGAGAALYTFEKLKIKSKAARVAGMIAGIALTGVLGGSLIANYIGKKIINPILKTCQKQKYRNNTTSICTERTPELIDVALHVDDIATVGVMSGLKWIEPALPVLYSISGYRAGIGYRNGKTIHNIKECKKFDSE